MTELRVGIVGAGYAGSAAALFLERAGHRVTLYEAVENPAPVGAGILLQPTGQCVLAELGLLRPVLERGARVDRLRCRTPGRRQLFDLPYERTAPGLFGVGLHRGVLFETLFRAIEATRVTLRLGVRIVALDGDRSLRDDRGRAHGPHDVIVVADGARSQIRAADFPRVQDRQYPWGALWFVAEDSAPTFARELHQVVQTTRKMAGFLPTGHAPEGSANLTSLFWSLPVDAHERFRQQPLDDWKEEVLSFEPRAESLLAQVQHQDQLLFATYRDVRMSRWHRDRVVFIGDAAHAMSPQLGQGSNLALMDAEALAQALTDGCRRGQEVPAMVATYQSLRQAHTRFYEWANRLCTPFFQGDSVLAGWLRDALFPLATAVPYVSHRMVRTMCGLERGVFRAPLPAPAPLLPTPAVTPAQ